LMDAAYSADQIIRSGGQRRWGGNVGDHYNLDQKATRLERLTELSQANPGGTPCKAESRSPYSPLQAPGHLGDT
jgi:hypothetical protein